EIAVGGGLYMPDPEVLRELRRHIAEHHSDLRKILNSARLKRLLGELHGEQLSRVPKGFPADHPAADLLRYKRFILYIQLPPETASGTALLSEIVQRFRVMSPFIDFLNVPFQPVRKRIDARELLL